MSHLHNVQMYEVKFEQSNSSQALIGGFDLKEEQVSIIRKEFVDLTGNPFSATILNQLLYWTLRVKDFDLFLEEERALPILEGDEREVECQKLHGWIYKTAHELIDETMLGISHPTMRKYLKQLIDEGWICERVHPRNKWNKTTQYRVNIRKILKDLIAIDRHLPAIYRKAFSSLEEEPRYPHQVPSLNQEATLKNNGLVLEKSPFLQSNVRNLHSSAENFHSDVNSSSVKNVHSDVSTFYSDLENFDSSVSPLHSNENPEKNFVPSTLESHENPNVKILHSNAENFHSDVNILQSNVENLQPNVSSFHSNVRNLHSNTEIITENTNKEHTQRKRAREDKNFENDFSGKVIRIWNTCLSQGGLVPSELASGMPPVQLTDERRRKIHTLFPLYFENDLNQWKQFCERVSSSPFLMGQGARKWRVSLDWILCEENLLKVLEGNFDDGNILEQKTEKVSEESRKKEIKAVLASIEDPVWRKLCSQLDFSRESHESISLEELKAIANARLLEVEDDRLVWIGSSDAQVLSRIENLRLKLLSTIKRTFPKVRNLRTRLDEKSPSLQPMMPSPHVVPTKLTQHKGGISYAK